MTRALLNVSCVSALYRNVLLSKYYFPEGIIPDDASGRDLCRRSSAKGQIHLASYQHLSVFIYVLLLLNVLNS